MRPKIYLFGWPSLLGGANTKVMDLLRLLHGEYDWTLVPNADKALEDGGMCGWLRGLGVKVARWEELPRKLVGTGLGICNTWWLAEGRAIEAKARGLRLLWGNEMMWHHSAELGAVMAGILDGVLYVAPEQRAALEPGYLKAAGGTVREQKRGGRDGLGARGRIGGMRWWMVGNYVDAGVFPAREGERKFPGEFVIGRLSRADVAKFPKDFPERYEGLRLSTKEGRVRYRVMAWSQELGRLWKVKSGESRQKPGHWWELLPAMAEEAGEFLRSLDLWVYDLGEANESWGRSTVEAMLSGAVPLVPAATRHHLHQLVPHGIGGFHCATRGEWGKYARLLQKDSGLREKMAQAAREYALEEICPPAKHKAVWREALEG